MLRSTIGEGGTGTLTVKGEGALSVKGTLDVGRNPTGNGTLTLDGGASGTTLDGFVIGREGVGGLEVTGGSALFSNKAVLGEEPGSFGTALIEGPGSRWDITGSFDIGLSGAALVSVLNEGILCIGENSVFNGGPQGQYIGDGDVYIGAFSPACPDLSQGRSRTTRPVAKTASSLAVTMATPALFLAEGAVVEADAVILDEGGVLGGDGALDLPITNAGTLSPGGVDSTGVFTVRAGYEQTAQGTLEIDFGGTTVGEDYDRLAVTGEAVLGGTLRLGLVDGHVPVIGESYTILTAGSVVGTFGTVEEPPDVELDVGYAGTEVTATVTAVTVDNEKDPVLPLDFALHPIYPNPFNPQAVIPFSVAEVGRVRLAVYDLLGRSVATLVDEVKQTGSHKTIFNGRELGGGVYLVRMTVGDFTQTRRVTLLR